MSNEIATRKVGRPLKFPSPDKLQERIDEYFDSCEAKKKPFNGQFLTHLQERPRLHIAPLS